MVAPSLGTCSGLMTVISLKNKWVEYQAKIFTAVYICNKININYNYFSLPHNQSIII